MSTAADLIHALQRRWRLTHFRARPGEFPPGWQAWFEHMRERTGAVTGASAEAIVAVLLQRELSLPPGRALALNRWQAFSTLWRQEWQPPAREERWVRTLAAVVSGLVHVAFALLVLWLGIVQFMVASAPPRGEESVVQVEYIGRGTPEEVGGGPQPEAEVEPVEPRPVEQEVEQEVVQERQAEPPQEPQPPTRTVDEPTPAPRPPQLPELPVQPAVPQLQAPQPQVVQREVPEPQPVAEQPLTVSKPVPDRSSFVLPAPTIEPPEPEIAMPSLQVPVPRVEAVTVPEPLPEFTPNLPQAELEIENPSLRSEIPEVTVREVPAPLPQVQAPQMPRPTVAVPELQAEVPQVREVTIPTPATPEPSEPAVADIPAEAPTDTPVESTQSSTPAPTGTAAPAPVESVAETPAPVAGAGPEPVPAPGGWPTPEAADDWGLSESEQPGRQAGQPPGLYDSDGSVNLAETPGSASPGLPPGTITEEIADLDRAGTWLKRPPTGYEPTVFAKYWRPNESLLAEWVRKSISTVRIPIPGTNKSIVCQTVLLAVGGSCWVQDPNLNNQPASARPPPDIPFKPELQEGNGSVPPEG